ncbi:MAG: tetratricopeptide repeat protein [Bacteroidota bacterium]
MPQLPPHPTSPTTQRAPVQGRAGLLLLPLLILLALPAQALAADAVCEDADFNTKATNYSLYYESFKNEDYQAAMPYLRWVLDCAPTFSGDPERPSARNIQRGITAYEALAVGAGEPAMQQAYVDSALALYDVAVPTLQEAGMDEERIDPWEWTLNKGRFIQKHEDIVDEDTKALYYDLYREAYEMDAERLQPYYYTLIIFDAFRDGDREATIEIMEKGEELYPDEESLINYIDQVRNSLFKDPLDRIDFLQSRLERSPGDVEILTELFELYRQEEMRDEMYDVGQQLSESDPTAKTLQILGEMNLEDGDAEAAMELLQRALDMMGDEGGETARDIYFNMGVAQQELGRLSRARGHYRSALEADPDFGRALLAIGDLYTTAVSQCGSLEREDKAVYWLAADYYERAKSRDSALTNSANARISNIRSYFPNNEDKFFNSWQPGQSYTVNYGCYGWIGETTRVR